MKNEVLIVANRRVDPATGEVEGPNGTVQIEPKVLEFLLVLAATPGVVVSKADLLSAVWPETAVTDDVIWRCVAALRRAFDDDARAPRVIETFSRRGYRLIGEVMTVPSARVSASDAAALVRRSPGGLYFWAGALTAAALAIGVIGWQLATERATGTIGLVSPDAERSTSPRSTEAWAAVDFTRAGREYYEAV